jgi:hypothetical protein
MSPVLDLARRLDIATNPHPAAIFEAGSGGFQVWCTPHDHPRGWNGIVMNEGAFSKPCEYVGGVHWKWEGEQIVALAIETSAYALADQKPGEYCNLGETPKGSNRRTIFNRDDDIEWLKEKVTWLFAEAGVPLPPLACQQAAFPETGPHLLTHYTSEFDEYVVIVSPELDPQEFCKSGYEVARTLEIWNAGDFPADIILRPEEEFQDLDIEPDEGPLVEQYENAARMHDDDWLEGAYEDRSGTWEEQP